MKSYNTVQVGSATNIIGCQISFSGRISKVYMLHGQSTMLKSKSIGVKFLTCVSLSKQNFCSTSVTATLIKGKLQQDTITQKNSPQYSSVMYSICILATYWYKRSYCNLPSIASDIPCICNSLVFHFKVLPSIPESITFLLLLLSRPAFYT